MLNKAFAVGYRGETEKENLRYSLSIYVWITTTACGSSLSRVCVTTRSSYTISSYFCGVWASHSVGWRDTTNKVLEDTRLEKTRRSILMFNIKCTICQEDIIIHQYFSV